MPADPNPAPSAATASPAPRAPVVPHRARGKDRVLSWLIGLFFQCLFATMRVRVHDRTGLLEPGMPARPVLFALWHNRLALALMLHRKLVRGRFPGRKLAALVSASRDGGLLACLLERFDIQPVRGSSSRRGAQALVELRSWAARGHDLAITPDGPRGPCYTIHEGVITAAKTTGLPIVPVAYTIHWKLRLRSWDRFQVPLPFSRIDLHAAPPLKIPADCDDATRKRLRDELRTRMLAITED
jgi:hypothetical protein